MAFDMNMILELVGYYLPILATFVAILWIWMKYQTKNYSKMMKRGKFVPIIIAFAIAFGIWFLIYMFMPDIEQTFRGLLVPE